MFVLAFNLPGENVFAGVGVRKGTKLSDHHTLLCDGSHIRICSDKPGQSKEGKGILSPSQSLWFNMLET